MKSILLSMLRGRAYFFFSVALDSQQGCKNISSKFWANLGYIAKPFSNFPSSQIILWNGSLQLCGYLYLCAFSFQCNDSQKITQYALFSLVFFTLMTLDCLVNFRLNGNEVQLLLFKKPRCYPCYHSYKILVWTLSDLNCWGYYI